MDKFVNNPYPIVTFMLKSYLPNEFRYKYYIVTLYL